MVDVNMGMAMWKRRLMVELKRDTKKTALLGLLLIVAMFCVGRLIVGNTGPRNAVACPVNAVVRPSVMKMEEASPKVSGGLEDSAPNDRVVKPVERKFERDVFEPDWDLFPRAKKDQSDDGEGRTGLNEVDEELVKARTVLEEADNLVLQSTVQSDQPTAVINGKVLRVGDRIDGFEVVEIRPEACDVRKNGVEVTLFMKQ